MPIACPEALGVLLEEAGVFVLGGAGVVLRLRLLMLRPVMLWTLRAFKILLLVRFVLAWQQSRRGRHLSLPGRHAALFHRGTLALILRRPVASFQGAIVATEVLLEDAVVHALVDDGGCLGVCGSVGSVAAILHIELLDGMHIYYSRRLLTGSVLVLGGG